jgi:hypothetical protein
MSEDAIGLPLEPRPAPHEAVREAVTMALYLCIVLAAEFVAFGERVPNEGTAVSVIWGTAVGLALAHVFAFNLAARLLIGAHLSHETRAAVWAQLGAAAAIALVVTLPFLVFSLEVGLEVSAFLITGLVGFAAYAASRQAGAGRARSLVDGLVVLAVAVVVVSVKVGLSGH